MITAQSPASRQQAHSKHHSSARGASIANVWHGHGMAAEQQLAMIEQLLCQAGSILGTHKGWSQDTLSARLLVSIHRQSKVQRKHEAAWAVRVITRLSPILSTPRQCNLSTLSKVSVFTNGTFDSATRDAPPPLRNPVVIAAEYYRRAPCRAALRDADGGWGMRDARRRHWMARPKPGGI